MNTINITFYSKQAETYPREEYFLALRWDNPQRNTDKVCRRVNELLSTERIHCVWSGKHIKKSSKYDADHAFPFARWPNNNLWNLVPSKRNINLLKADKLPSSAKLATCRKDIVRCWQLAWSNNSRDFLHRLPWPCRICQLRARTMMMYSKLLFCNEIE